MAFLAARETPMAEMNVTPLVDVMLVLLIIFMVTAPAMSQALSLNLPFFTPPENIKKVTEMTLQVQAGDLYALDGQTMSREQVTTVLTAVAAQNPDIKVNLDVDPNADYQSAMYGMAAVRNAGIDAIALPSEN
jgi:biopolymer transport protein ExbD/biopolymer transport protein TolR